MITNTQSPSDDLEAMARKRFKGNFIAAQIAEVLGANVATVDYDLGTHLNEASIVFAAQTHFVDFGPKVFEQTKVDSLELRAFTSFKDPQAKPTQGVVIKFTLSREVAEKMNSTQIVRRRVQIALATDPASGVFVHPALRAAWDKSQR